jgi:transposase-like protein
MTDRDKRLPESADKLVRDVRRATRRKLSSEEMIRIVLEGLRGEETIAEICRKEGIAQNLYYRWSKDFLEAGKKRLAGDTTREAGSDEVKGLRVEARQLKCAIADFVEHYNLTRVMNIIGVGPLIAAMREFLNVFFAQQPCPRFRSPSEPH